MALALASLAASCPLYGGVLPNKSYDVHTLQMTDYRNQPAPEGTGWSAIDLGRLLVPLNVIAWQHPRHTEAARRVVARWNTAQLRRAASCGACRPARAPRRNACRKAASATSSTPRARWR